MRPPCPYRPRMNSSGPIAPSSASFLARMIAGWKRWLKPTLTIRLRCREAASSGATSAGRRPAGFSQHMTSGLDRRERDWREPIVRRRNHYGIGVDSDRLAPVGERTGARLLRQPRPALGIGIAYRDDLMTDGGGCPFRADQTTSDDHEPHQRSPQVLPRSLGTMRRRA